MRDIKAWRKDLTEAIQNSKELNEYLQSNFNSNDHKDQDKEAKRLSRLIAEVEMGITLLKQIFPESLAYTVEYLLDGVHYAMPELVDEKNWKSIQIMRFYLIDHKGSQWKNSLKEYEKLPSKLRIYKTRNDDSFTEPIPPEKVPTSIYPKRYQLYIETLRSSPKRTIRKIRYAGPGKWFCRVFKDGNLPLEIPITIPACFKSLKQEKTALQVTRKKENPKLVVKLEELYSSAREMDQTMTDNIGECNQWVSRLKRVSPQIFNNQSGTFSQSDCIELENAVHIVGLLNVGKSTLLEILTFHMAKQGKRCALIVNDVVTAIKLSSMFRHELGISAVPVLGREKEKHLKRAFQTIFTEKNPNQKDLGFGLSHPAQRWFSPCCPLLGLIKSEEKWAYGQEPCHRLFPKKEEKTEEEEENSIFSSKPPKGYTCPFYTVCPQHQQERDLADSKVWILTPASLVTTHTPSQVFDENCRFAEIVYRECDLFFIDEVDRVQCQLDEKFSPYETLINNSKDSWLNKLGHLASSIYNSARQSMKGDLVLRWMYAQYTIQHCSNRIYNLLLNTNQFDALNEHPHSSSRKVEQLDKWYGRHPLTSQAIFSKILKDLLFSKEHKENRRLRAQKKRSKASVEQQEKWLEDEKSHRIFLESLGTFLQDPLGLKVELNFSEVSEVTKDIYLTEITDKILSETEQGKTFRLLELWIKTWNDLSKSKTNASVWNKIQEKNQQEKESVLLKVLLAILITILRDRLHFIINDLPKIHSIMDLRDLVQNFVNRPPYDYLPVLPEPPVGNLLGIRYLTDKRKPEKAGALDYFRYVSLGRSLLLNFPTLFQCDDWDGPHTIFISGTSFAPGSPSYHLLKSPDLILSPRLDKDHDRNCSNPVKTSGFYFHTLFDQGKPIVVSGVDQEKKKEAIQGLVNALSSSETDSSLLNKIFEKLKQQGEAIPELWRDRERILCVTGSYEQAEWAAQCLKQNVRGISPGEIINLKRDSELSDEPGIPRSQIDRLKDTPYRIVFAPLLALERGHNILNSQDIAAFGAVLFLVRPMPVPDDWQIIVQTLNAWALEYEQMLHQQLKTKIGKQNKSLEQAAKLFRKAANEELFALNKKVFSYARLSPKERSTLCWNQFVRIWQIIGRLIRGNVPALVYFLDATFAPESAEGRTDSAETSILVAMIKELETLLEGEESNTKEKVLGNSLYADFLTALQKTEGLNYV